MCPDDPNTKEYRRAFRPQIKSAGSASALPAVSVHIGNPSQITAAPEPSPWGEGGRAKRGRMWGYRSADSHRCGVAGCNNQNVSFRSRIAAVGNRSLLFTFHKDARCEQKRRTARLCMYPKEIGAYLLFAFFLYNEIGRKSVLTQRISQRQRTVPCLTVSLWNGFKKLIKGLIQ